MLEPMFFRILAKTGRNIRKSGLFPAPILPPATRFFLGHLFFVGQSALFGRSRNLGWLPLLRRKKCLQDDLPNFCVTKRQVLGLISRLVAGNDQKTLVVDAVARLRPNPLRHVRWKLATGRQVPMHNRFGIDFVHVLTTGTRRSHVLDRKLFRLDRDQTVDDDRCTQLKAPFRRPAC